MRILIGTPVHQVKDYSMERWLANVAKLDYPTDFLIVDNSPTPEYMQIIRNYCARYGITDYTLKHLELPTEMGKHERIARSREVIRQEFLAHDYDAWFAWECDILLPPNTLGRLIKIMEDGNYLMVNPNKWARENPENLNTDFGCCLIARQALEKYGFILEFDSDPDVPKTWETGEAWFKARVLRGGGSYIDVYGVINPIYHLDK